MGQLDPILPSAVSIGNLCSMRSPTLVFEKFGTPYLCVVPSLLFACPCCRWAFLYVLLLFFVFQSSITACYRFSAFLLTLFIAISVLTLCCLSQESLGCLNWLMYLALPHEVSICWSQGYCLLSLEKISWLP